MNVSQCCTARVLPSTRATTRVRAGGSRVFVPYMKPGPTIGESAFIQSNAFQHLNAICHS